MLKKILTAWCHFLDSSDSLYALNDSPSGWKCAAAQRAVGIEQFEHDPADEHWGFTSWNDFFTRRFKDGQRPVAAPDDDTVIVSACESTPHGIAADVARQDRFWIKSQPYSLRDLLAHDESVDQFVGGTIHQAFLSATNYHRWHSPVAGTIARAFIQEGTYYSEADSEGSDAVEPTNSQSYMAHTAARAIILPTTPSSAWWPSCRSACRRCPPASSTRASPRVTTSPRVRNSGTSSSAAPRTASSFAPA